MNELQIFKNEDFGEIRSLIVDNEPWFVGKDVANILGYSNTRKAINDHVDEEDKGVTKCDTLGGKQDLIVINESGLYSLILSSKLATAKKFKRWVTSEVLPAIRKTGRYQVPNDPMTALKLMFDAQTQTKKTVANHDYRITELEENKLLTPGEYNYLNHQVRNRIKTIKEVKKLALSSKQNSKLYSFINRDLNMLVGIRTRSQFRAKDFDKALDFISNWNPSYTDLKIIEEITE
uniref:BRO family protein n=1 Tax=Thomasclavelia spiroformis TaxID=29348 RepID=UPI00359C28FB